MPIEETVKRLLPPLLVVLVLLGACGTDPPQARKSPGPDAIAVVLGKEVTRKDADNIDGIIFGALRDKFAEDNRVEATDSEIDAFAARMATELPEEFGSPAEIDRDLARSFVETWKINKAFYDEYGGRVIFQQFGPEPVDAYRRYLEEQEKEGSFEILDKTYEDELWNYFVNDGSHSFYSDEEGARVMSKPWWELEDSER